MRRTLRIAAALAAGLAAAGWALQEGISHRIETRLRAVIEAHPGVTGEVDRVSTCLPCLAYTIHGVRLDAVDGGGGGDARLLEADEVEVSLLPASLLRGSPRAQVVLRRARLDLDADREAKQEGTTAFGIAWQEVGRQLSPAPIERVDAGGGIVTLHYGQLAKPVRWRFELDRARAEHLTPGEHAGRAAARGRTPGGGTFELLLAIGGEDHPARLTGALHDVALAALRDTIQERAGLDVESGNLSAAIDLEGAVSGWKGHIDCEVRDLDLFELDDVTEHGPLQAVRDGAAQLFSSLRRSDDGALHLRIDVDERYGEPAGDAWRAGARIVRTILLAPFVAPLHILSAIETSAGGD